MMLKQITRLSVGTAFCVTLLQAETGKSIFTLETGYRATTAGPILAMRDGRILWLTSGPEGMSPGTYAISRTELRESRDGGRTWGTPRVLRQGNKSAVPGSMALMELRSGRLLHLTSLYGGYSNDHDVNKSLNEGYAQWSDDKGATWSRPVKLPTGERYLSSVLSATQLSSGRIIFPFGYLVGKHGQFMVSSLYSDDDGVSWKRSPSVLDVTGTGFESGATEPSVAELPGGRPWMVIRAQTGFHWESFSDDNGVNWTPAQESRFPASNAPMVLLRLRSGRIIAVWNHSVQWAYARHVLVAAATDDGKNFFGFREIDHTDYPLLTPEKYWGAMYPYLTEASDGTILVAYNFGDWNYNQAKLARLAPSWFEQRALQEDFSEGRSAWCRLGGSGDSLISPDDNEPGATLQVKQSGTALAGIVRNFPQIAQGVFRVEGSVNKGDGYLLWHDSFLYPGHVEEACLRVRFAPDGRVLIGAGTPSRKSIEKPAWSPKYSYLSYPVNSEREYPTRWAAGKRFKLRVDCDTRSRTASVSIDDGPVVKVDLGEVLGLSYFGVAATQGGSICVRRLATNDSRAALSPQTTKWSEDRAARWYSRQPWLLGSNYIPASAINQLEMWQADTFDPQRIDLELGWAQGIGMNTMRVFLHDLPWKEDAPGFRARIDRFLAIASRRGIRPVLVLFDSCWDPFPALGRQHDPKPGVHNSGWVQSPGAAALQDAAQFARLEAYVTGVVGAFANDPRVLAWDVWNEPSNGNRDSYGNKEPANKTKLVLALLPKVFAWARAAHPVQPLTAGVWAGEWGDPKKLSAENAILLEQSDVISFHNYKTPDDFERRVKDLQQYKRPLLCTEFMARGSNSTFQGVLPIARKYKVAAINWGLVAGRTQTYLPWDSWRKPYVGREPSIWFHEVFRTDGTPYRVEEVDLLRELTAAK